MADVRKPDILMKIVIMYFAMLSSIPYKIDIKTLIV